MTGDAGRRPVLDPHDVYQLTRAVYERAIGDIAHQSAHCDGGPACRRGGHTCETCGRLIWDCAEDALTDMEDRVKEFGLSGFVGTHCGICDAKLVDGECPNAGQLGHHRRFRNAPTP